MSTIFGDVKKFIGITAENTAFDDDLLALTNGAFSVLTRVGATGKEGFNVTTTTTWEEYSTDVKLVNMTKEYIRYRVKISFDSSTMSSFVLTSYEKLADEALWTVNNYADYWNQQNGGGDT